MTRGRIINALVFLVVLGVALGVYLFYFKDKLKDYKDDLTFQQSLEQLADSLEEDFDNTRPEVIIGAWKNQVIPFTDDINSRAKYFGKAGWSDHEKYAKGEGIIKFWYSKKSEKMITDFYQQTVPAKLGGDAVRIGRFPMPGVLMNMLGITNVEQWSGMNVNEKTVHDELARLSYGLSACELIMDAKPTAIYNLAVGGVYTKQAPGKLLKFRSLGYSMTMNMKSLVDFIESLRMSDIYYSVDALSIKYANIAVAVEPQMNVQILITRATYEEPKAGVGTGGGAGGAPGSAANVYQGSFGGGRMGPGMGRMGPGMGRMGPGMGGGGTPAQQPGAFKKAWKWFNRVFLARNV
jgi:hypothetical protein